MNFLSQMKKQKNTSLKKTLKEKLLFKKSASKASVLKLFFKKYLAVIIGFSCLLCLFIVLSPYIFRPWTKYPSELKAEIAWQKFTNSFTGSCRESCLASRQSYASVWRPIYLEQAELRTEKLTEVFSGDNSELQKAMIKIMAADLGSDTLPPIFAKLLMDDSVSDENKRLIVVFFPTAFDDPAWLEQIRGKISDSSLRPAERAYALSLLASYPQPDNTNFLKRIILRETNEEILEAAFKVASTWPNGALNFSEEELNSLKRVIIATPLKKLRWRRIWLISELDSGSSISRKVRLKELAEKSNLDNISRGLAAEALRLEFSLEINTPEPTAPEWQELYEYL